MSFFDFKDEELNVPERLIFTANVPVTMKIIEMKEVAAKEAGKYDYVELICSVKDGEFSGKLFTLFLSKNPMNKVDVAAVLTMFAPIDDWKNKTVQPSVMIGASFTCIPKVPKLAKNGKFYQSFTNYAIVKEPTTEVKVDDIGF